MTLHRRDVISAVMMWLEDADLTSSGVEVLPPNIRWPTDRFDVVATLRLEGLEDVPRGTGARGELMLDVGAGRIDSGAPATFDAFSLPRAIGDLKAALQKANLPVFDHRAADAASVAVGQTSGVLAAGGTSVLVVGGDAFQVATKELLIGSELVSWTTKTPAGADATFSGLGRALQKTLDKAHPDGTSVRDALGNPIAFLEMGESAEDDLGWDVATQRWRALLRLPFRADFAT